jgi:hypothetical protein
MCWLIDGGQCDGDGMDDPTAQGRRFHNGKPLTTEDVAFTLRRIADRRRR